jgi:hypothetical protein
VHDEDFVLPPRARKKGEEKGKGGSDKAKKRRAGRAGEADSDGEADGEGYFEGADGFDYEDDRGEADGRLPSQTMFVARGVPDDGSVVFAPKTRQEVGEIGWFELSSLPSGAHGKRRKAFWPVVPYLAGIRHWIGWRRQQDKVEAAAGARSSTRGGAVGGGALSGIQFIMLAGQQQAQQQQQQQQHQASAHLPPHLHSHLHAMQHAAQGPHSGAAKRQAASAGEQLIAAVAAAAAAPGNAPAKAGKGKAGKAEKKAGKAVDGGKNKPSAPPQPVTVLKRPGPGSASAPVAGAAGKAGAGTAGFVTTAAGASVPAALLAPLEAARDDLDGGSDEGEEGMDDAPRRAPKKAAAGGAAGVLDVEGKTWSASDMFAANERLLGRAFTYDGNPHTFGMVASAPPPTAAEARKTKSGAAKGSGAAIAAPAPVPASAPAAAPAAAPQPAPAKAKAKQPAANATASVPAAVVPTPTMRFLIDFPAFEFDHAQVMAALGI